MDGFEGRVLLGHVTGVKGELIIPLHRVTPVLYPRVCVLCHLPAGYRFPTSSPTCCCIGGGMQRRITQCSLKPADIMDQTFPIGIKPFLICFKWKKVVRIWVRHSDSFLFIEIFRVGVDLCMLSAYCHHRKMPILIPMLHR